VAPVTKTNRFLSCCLASALLVALPELAAAQACPLIVDPGGAGHFTDIQPAVNHFKASLGNLGPCTIEVRPGIYANSVSLDGVNSTATLETQRLVLRGTRGAGGSYLTGFSTGRRDAISVKRSKYVTLRDFEVLTTTNRPFAIEAGSAANRAITIDSNFLHDNGGGRDSGCVSVGDANVDTWVVNNTCWNNGSDAIVVGKGGPSYVVNNTVFLNRKSGIVVAKGTTATVANNLVLFNTLTGVLLSTSGGGVNGTRRLLHNISYGNAGADFAGQATATPPAPGNQSTATLGAGLLATHFFVDPAAGNFHLAGGSPALNAGIASTGSPERVPALDFEGDPRSGSPPDVGIDEVADADFDGQPDIADNCPPGLNSSYNPAQGDSDGDGVGNYCDNCPQVANSDQADLSGFDAFGSPVAEPNGRGDACEGVGESLFDVSTGPPADVVFVATFGVFGPTLTVPPDCATTYFYCEDALGNPLPRTHVFTSRGIPNDLTSYAAGAQVTVSCPLTDLFPLPAFADGTYTCKACYDNEHRDLGLREDGSCPAGGCVTNFEGMVCSAEQSLVIDSTVARNGCSPGYWKNHAESWPATGFATSDDFDASLQSSLFDPDRTLLAAMSDGGGDADALGRHGAAALLSASHPDVNYPYSADAVRALVRQGDPQGRLAAANTLGCPLSGSN
jgi:hypothetical protein